MFGRTTEEHDKRLMAVVKRNEEAGTVTNVLLDNPVLIPSSYH